MISVGLNTDEIEAAVAVLPWCPGCRSSVSLRAAVVALVNGAQQKVYATSGAILAKQIDETIAANEEIARLTHQNCILKKYGAIPALTERAEKAEAELAALRKELAEARLVR